MIRPFGDRSILVEVDGPEAAHSLSASLVEHPIDGVEAAIPALASVLVELADTAMSRGDRIAEELTGRLGVLEPAPSSGRVRTIPVAYGGRHGPDLDATAELLGMSAGTLAARHAATEVRVLFCGFAPGFAYLGDLPAELHAPRLATPRTRTPAGSVALTGSMTGIYPAELPGGWRVIGRTPLVLFDPHRDPPSYLAPGDTVRFRPMDAGDWPDAPVTADDW